MPLAPLHQPHNLAPIRLLLERAAGAAAGRLLRHRVPSRQPPTWRRRSRCRASSPTAACAATASTGCPTSTSPRRCRRYDAQAAAGKVVVLHLGNGVSMCAMDGGRSVASTMGFTAVDGLPMGTRCGSLDPGVILYLMDELRHGRARDREADLPAVGTARRVGHLERHAHAAGERRSAARKLADRSVRLPHRARAGLAGRGAAAASTRWCSPPASARTARADPRARLPRCGLAGRGARRRGQRTRRPAHQHARQAASRRG